MTFGDAQSIWLAPLMCIVSFFILAIFSRKLPYQGIYIPIAAMVFTLVLFSLAFVDYQQPVSVSIAWFEVAGMNLAWDLYVDAVSLSMIGLIAVVSLMVQIYSLQYMRGEERIGWYYAVLSLFAASMMLVVLSWNLVLLYAAWELVGVCSYLLIGFWYERRSAAEFSRSVAPRSCPPTAIRWRVRERPWSAGWPRSAGRRAQQRPRPRPRRARWSRRSGSRGRTP